MADPEDEKEIRRMIEERFPDFVPPSDDPDEEDMPLTPGAATWHPDDPIL